MHAGAAVALLGAALLSSACAGTRAHFSRARAIYIPHASLRHPTASRSYLFRLILMRNDRGLFSSGRVELIPSVVGGQDSVYGLRSHDKRDSRRWGC